VRANVLCSGMQHNLLRYRAEALERERFHVVTGVGMEETERLFSAGDFDLVVLCQSLAPEGQSALAALIRKKSPSTGIIALSESEERRPYADVTVPDSDIEVLVACCKAMFEPRPKAV
jgi:DNA-binding response OmpR family regulator